MNIELLTMGKTSSKHIIEGVELYEKRLKRYCSFSRREVAALRGTSSLRENQIKEREGELLLSQIRESDIVVLLDERGEQLSSIEFAKRIENFALQGRRVLFVVGGAYGFSDPLYSRANYKLSLSAMTFSHQLVRLLFMEQLYRAFTIIRGEPYHHQ